MIEMHQCLFLFLSDVLWNICSLLDCDEEVPPFAKEPIHLQLLWCDLWAAHDLVFYLILSLKDVPRLICTCTCQIFRSLCVLVHHILVDQELNGSARREQDEDEHSHVDGQTLEARIVPRLVAAVLLHVGSDALLLDLTFLFFLNLPSLLDLRFVVVCEVISRVRRNAPPFG